MALSKSKMTKGKQSEQQEKLAAHKSCQTLPLRKLVNLQNSQIKNNGYFDLKHLLVSDDWPDNYQDETLVDNYNAIMIEWQELRGDNFYLNNFDKQTSKQYDLLRIHALELINKCFYLGFEDIINEISEKFRFRGITSKEIVLSKIEQIKQKLELEEEEKTEFKKINLSDLLNDLRIGFGKKNILIQIDNNITVSDYESLRKRIING